MSYYEYPGYLKFVDEAVAELKLPQHAPMSRHLGALRAMDTMAVQLIAADAADHAGVVKQIQAQRDALMAAARAADLLYQHVARGLGLRYTKSGSGSAEVITASVPIAKKSRSR